MHDSYRELFLTESQEYLNNINSCLVKLEEDPNDLGAINEAFRCLHTLKGMSATMGYEKLAQLSHQMEDLLDELRSQRRKLTREIVNLLFASVDMLGQLVEEIKLKQELKIDISSCLQDLKNTLNGHALAQDVPLVHLERVEFSLEELNRLKAAKEKGLNPFNINITLVKDCVIKEGRAFMVITDLMRIGEIVKSFPSVEDLKAGKFDLSFIVVLITGESQADIREEILGISDIEDVKVNLVDVSEASSAPIQEPGRSYIKKIQSMRIPVERLDKIMNLMGELAIAKIRLLQLAQVHKIDALEEVSFGIDHLTSILQDEIMQTRLLPAGYILEVFPRVVRDLAKQQNKEVELEMVGGEIELDRVVLDEIGDPLIHLIRNAIDHGIENPEERQKLGKHRSGKILIKISRQRGQILIEVSDDGRGVDFNAVKEAALKKGLISQEEAGSIVEKKILDLITLPGFSTAKEVTNISGRGVGLDVVKARIESLGGMLDFETKPGEGSCFILTLPLTLAIIKAMLVKVQEEIFAVPLMNIRETIKIKKSEIKLLQHLEVSRIRDEIIPLVRLDKEFGIKSSLLEKDDLNQVVSLVIVEYGKRALGLVVNQIVGEQDIVVKPLGLLIKKTKGIAGATILGDGKVSLILDTMSLT
ncbi:MAG: chemotaxis protein CheA [Candidatus Omnitrophota bacterium]